MFDPDGIIATLLAADGPVEMTFDNGEATTLVPSRFVPAQDDATARVSLAGDWRVARWPFDRDERSLAAPATDDSAWPAVQQPGKVFYQDPDVPTADIPNWNRVKLDHIDADDGAVLRRRVVIPAAWAGRRVLLRFGAIYPAGRVYLNGELLGEHLSGLTGVEYDVTGRVSPGEWTTVAVRLLRKHKYVDLDMPRHGMEFAGLAQDAMFHCVEPVHVSSFHLLTTLDDSFRDGTVAGRVTVADRGKDASGDACVFARAGMAGVAAGAKTQAKAETAGTAYTVSLTLVSPEGIVVARTETPVSVPAGSSADADLRLAAANVECWNDEVPALYTVVIRLEAPGQPPQEISYRTGFRRLDLTPAGPRLNGRFIKFRGVNHLTFCTEGGLHTPKDWLRRNLTLMKRANVNAIRTHYLAPPVLVELCDEMGFYLMQELPIDWASHHVVTRACLGPVLQRLMGGILRDRHHPSVMAWSIGNENLPTEGGDAEVFWSNMHLFNRLAKTLAPTTATMFPPPGPANKIDGIFETRVGDIGDTHYSFLYARRLAETNASAEPVSWAGEYVSHTRQKMLERGWSGVWMSSEWGLFNYLPDVLNGPYLSVIADAMEDVTGGKNTQQVLIDRFARDWGCMRDDPTCLGGAFFPWMCAGAGDPWGWTYWGEDADWGVVTHDLTPKSAFWVMRVAYSPVVLPQRIAWHAGDKELRIPVRNLYNGRDLAECTFRTQMGGGPPWMGMLRAWKDIPIACPPGGTVEAVVPIWSADSQRTLESGQPIICRCIVLDPTGYRPITHDIMVIPE